MRPLRRPSTSASRHSEVTGHDATHWHGPHFDSGDNTVTTAAPVTPVALGLPAPCTPRRRPCRQVMVGRGFMAVPVGGSAPISVQSMTTTLTAGIDAGCAAVRVNPGATKKFDDKVRQIAAAADAPNGVNTGSLDRRQLTTYGKATPFEEHGFQDLTISVRHHDPAIMAATYRLLAARGDYPPHLGVTEAGPISQGSVAFGIMLSAGIGDTIRVSGAVARRDTAQDDQRGDAP